MNCVKLQLDQKKGYDPLVWHAWKQICISICFNFYKKVLLRKGTEMRYQDLLSDSSNKLECVHV